MRPITFKIFKRLLSSFVLVLAFTSCQEIGEADISCSKILLLTPPDSLNAASGVFQFKWEEVDDAITYNFELATPDFDLPLYYHTDTITSSSEISVALSAGEYAWRVQAQNASSSTEWFTRTLFVEVSEGLDGVPMSLSMPVNNGIFSNPEIEFGWQEIELAEFYTFQLLYNNNGEVGDVFSLAQPQIASLEMNVPEGTWYWRVQGEIFGSAPSNYAQRSLIVDQTAPSLSVPDYPLGDALLAENNNFEWTPSTDVLTDVVETIEIFSDAEATQLVESFSNAASPLLIDLTDYSVGVYYWGIYSQDEAGNYSESLLESFEIQ